MLVALGVDFGGTNTKTALVDEKGGIWKKVSFPTINPFEKDKWIESLEKAFQELSQGKEDIELIGIGVGVAGLVSPEEGIIKRAPNVANIDGWNMSEALNSRFHVPVVIDNDVNAVALGELLTHNSGQDMIVITLGTGVGGALILGGRLYRGSRCLAGELGHMTINESGPICNCGNEGCAETYLGNQRIVGRFKEILKEGAESAVKEMVDDIEEITPEIIFEAARKGDSLSLQTWNKVAKHLGTLLANLINLLNPEKIIIGGGVANAFEIIEKPLWETIKKRAMKASLEGLKIEQSVLASDAGVIGAASLVLEKGDCK